MSLEVIDAVGALTTAHLSIEPDLATGHTASPGAGLWLIRRLCDEVRLQGVAGSARLCLRLHRQAQDTA